MPPKRAIDPELAALATLIPEIDLADPARSREIERTVVGEMPRGPSADDFESFDLSRPDGSQLAIALHRPTHWEPPPGPPLPVLVFLHGGSFITGGLHSELQRCARYAETTTCAVVSVDYRLAPEDPFPAGLEDCLTVLDWIGNNAGDLGVDRERVAIGGLSAGGALAAGCALRLRDAHADVVPDSMTPPVGAGARSLTLVLQMLLFPVLDASMTTRSSREFIDTPILRAATLPGMWQQYLEPAAEIPQWASPSLATDVAGSPPTFIATAQFDPLRDEAIQFAQRLLTCDIPVDLHVYARSYHSFDTFHTTRMGRIAHQHQVDSLTAAFR